MFDNYEFVSLRMTGRLIYFGKYARILMEGAKERQLNSGWDGILGNVYTLNGNDWTPIGTISNPYLAVVRSSEQIAEWKKQGLSDEKIRELSLKDGVISSVLAPVDVNGVTNLLNNGASKEELVRFAMLAAFGRATSGSSKLSKVTDGSSGSGGHAAKGGSPGTVTYFRVEGGGSGTKTSQNRIIANEDGTITITPGCAGQICVSVGNADHATYYLTNKRPDGSVIVFDVDAGLHKEIMEKVIPQRPVPGIPRNPDAPERVDPGQPGYSLELPKVWESLLEKIRVMRVFIPKMNFLRHSGNDIKSIYFR